MYELMLVSTINGIRVPDGVDAWRRGARVDPLPPPPLTVRLPQRDEPLPQCFRSLAPIIADDVLAFLRERGAADSLQTVAAEICIGDAAGVGGYSVVNVVGTIPLASFFASLPAPETFGHRVDSLVSKMHDIADMVPKIAARAATLPKPNAPIARLAEANKPLIIRSDVARELEARKISGVKFDDVRFCELYIGTVFYSLASDTARG